MTESSNSDSRTRVLIVSPFENRLAKRGTRLPILAELLTEWGFEVQYVTTNFSHAYKAHFSKGDIDERCRLEPYKLTVFHIPAYKKNVSVRRVLCNIIMSIRCHLLLLREAKKGDVILVPSRPVSLIFAMAMLKVFRKVRLVMDIRDAWPDALVGCGRFKFGIFWIYCGICLYPSVRWFDAFAHISPSFVDWLHRYAPRAKSRFIPLGFDEERWKSVLPKTSIPSRPVTIGFVGLLQHQLDVMPVLEALSTRPDLRLIIVGDSGTGERYAEVSNYIKSAELKNVELIGRVPPEEVVRILRDVDIGLIPMISNSIPNKVFDCIAAYLPMIVLGNEDCAGFITELDIGWCASFDRDAVGSLLDRISPEQILVKSRNVERVRNRFSREVLFREFIEVIGGSTQGN